MGEDPLEDVSLRRESILEFTHTTHQDTVRHQEGHFEKIGSYNTQFYTNNKKAQSF